MKLLKFFFIFSMSLLVVTTTAVAGDFGWTKDLNIQAQADPSGFRARLATRFNLGDADVKVVLSNFDSPSDAYIALRLGEMSGRSIDYVTDRYEKHKGNGWGALAKELGIKPGSDEFHALKGGHDLYSDTKHGQVSHSGNGKNKNKGKGHGNNKGIKTGKGEKQTGFWGVNLDFKKYF